MTCFFVCDPFGFEPKTYRLIDNSSPAAISNVKLNEYVEEVAKETGFNELVSLEKHVAGEKIILTLPLSDLISTHTAPELCHKYMACGCAYVCYHDCHRAQY